MKVCFKIQKNSISDDKITHLKKFIKFLQNSMPLSGEIELWLLNKPIGKMTTGSYNHKKSRIKELVKNRILADIFRTISHEWAHAYDRQKIKIKDRQDIGGDSENFANSVSGALTKYYIKSNPKFKEEFYS